MTMPVSSRFIRITGREGGTFQAGLKGWAGEEGSGAGCEYLKREAAGGVFSERICMVTFEPRELR